MVNALGSALVNASLLGARQATNVPDIGDWVSSYARTRLVVLIVLVIQQEVALVIGIQNSSLVGVGSAFVGSDGNYFGICLVGNVIDCECVFVVAVADLFAFILLVRTAVSQTLCVVNVTIGRGTIGYLLVVIHCSIEISTLTSQDSLASRGR